MTNHSCIEEQLVQVLPHLNEKERLTIIDFLKTDIDQVQETEFLIKMLKRINMT